MQARAFAEPDRRGHHVAARTIRTARIAVALAATAAIALTACAKAETPAAGGTGSAPATTAPPTTPPAAQGGGSYGGGYGGGGGRYGDTGGGTSGQGTGGTGSATLGTRTISGIGTVLTTSEGLTLYALPAEKGAGIQCTGSCATAWPPLLVTGGNAPTLPQGASGTVGTITRPDGSVEVTYNDMPLYTWQGDSGPGQATGQGVGGFVAVTVS
jgi:predicted lipoprotein with Yx(FWY)xxD motif